MSDRVVLAYSGGLDTSVAIGWIANETGKEVVAVAADVGQGGEDLEVIRQRALDCGAVEAVVADVPRRVRRRVLPAGAAGQRALHGPLPAGVGAVAGRSSSSTSSPAARYHGADTVAHGCTGKGNDQVRFEVGIGALAPELTCIAPVRDSGMTRDKAIAFAEERGLRDRRHQEVAVLRRPERLGPRGRDRLPRGPVERPDRGRLQLHAGARHQQPDPDELVLTFTDGVPTAHRRQARSRCCRRSRSSTPAPAPRASAGSTWSRTGWSASRAARSTRSRVRRCSSPRTRSWRTSPWSATCARFKRGVEQRWAELVYDGLWFSPAEAGAGRVRPRAASST